MPLAKIGIEGFYLATFFIESHFIDLANYLPVLCIYIYLSMKENYNSGKLKSFFTY